MGSLVAIILLLLASCASSNPTFVPDAPPGPDDDEVSYCGAACKKWVEYGCGNAEVCERFAEPNDDCVEVITCEQWCKRIVVEAPAGVVFHPQCVAMAEPLASVPDVCEWLDAKCGDEP
jgi:hypothetical protein